MGSKQFSAYLWKFLYVSSNCFNFYSFIFDRESFFGLVGDISELGDKNYNDEARQKTKIKSIEDKKVSKEYQDLK